MEIAFSATADDQIIVAWQMKCIILQKFQDGTTERQNAENVSKMLMQNDIYRKCIYQFTGRF